METWVHCEFETSKGSSWTAQLFIYALPFFAIYDGAVPNTALPAAAGEICGVNAQRHNLWLSTVSGTAVGLQRSHRTADKVPKQKANKCLVLVIPSHAPFHTTHLELKSESSNKINVGISWGRHKILYSFENTLVISSGRILIYLMYWVFLTFMYLHISGSTQGGSQFSV